jgi:hypothetical protein
MMANIPNSRDFLVKVFKASMRNALPWETTADPKALLAELEGEYSVKIEEVPQFDEGDPEPDYVLSLQKGRQSVMKLDRRDFSPEEFQGGIFNLYGFNHAHGVLKEIWTRAYYKANKISDAVDAANYILDKMLGETDDVPF